MAFNRYAIYQQKYETEIRQWDWHKLTDKMDRRTNEWGERYYSAWLGTTLGIMPSGKVYTAWTTNQTSSDVFKDECFSAALETIAEENGCFVYYDDDSIFIGRHDDIADESEDAADSLHCDYYE
jgi:hypothetical protein